MLQFLGRQCRLLALLAHYARHRACSLPKCLAPGCRYAWDNAAGKLSTTFAAQAEKAIGSFSSRASNPVVQAVSTDAQEAVIWEVRASCAYLIS